MITSLSASLAPSHAAHTVQSVAAAAGAAPWASPVPDAWALPVLALGNAGTGSLPLDAFALIALLVALVWGLLLLGFGAALLRPMVVLAALVAGVVLAVVAVRTWVPSVPLWVAASVGGLVGVAIGALLYRPAVALLSALVGATLGAIVAWSIIATGGLDTRPRTSDHALVASLRESPALGEGERTSQEIIAILTAHAASADARGSASGLPPDAPGASTGDRLLHDLGGAATRAGERTRAALDATAPAYRTLLYGSILTGAVAAFLAGLLATTLVARVLTSFAGATLLLVAVVPLSAWAGHAVHLRDARAWLVAIASLAIVGVLAQTLLAGRGKAPPRRKAVKPGRAAPAKSEPAAA
jgi:hypothetical protein